MAVVIAFESSTRRLLKAIELGWDDSDPDDVAFLLPDEACKSDQVLYFVGGKFQYFFGYGRITSNLKIGKTGLWKGEPFWYLSPIRVLAEPVPARDVESATGFRVPQRPSVVPVELERSVWTTARGKPLIQVERAMEGATTEARSRYRNPQLRRTALELAKGVCEGCDVNYARRAGGLGRHCLVVHHKKQLRDTDQPRETRVTDLAVLCANCHLLVHSNQSRALSIAQLRRKLGRP